MSPRWLACLGAVGLWACTSPHGTDVPDASADAAPDFSVGADGAGPDVGSDADEIVYPSVFERGPYNVGHRRFQVTYDAALEPGREIKLVVWYPTLDTEGRAGTYLVSYSRREVFADATVAIEDEAPVLLFSHGNSALAEQSYFMTEFWASHGFVVAAPDHTGNTVYDLQGGVSFTSSDERPQDMSAALDFLYALPADDPLHGKISDDVVMTGHSFGGYTTLAVSGSGFAIDEVVEFCAQPNAPQQCEMLDEEGIEDVFRAGFLDERIDVAIPQAPGGFFFFQEYLSQIEIPSLVMTAARDGTLLPTQEAEPIWAAMTGRHMRLDFTNAGHFTFSNMCQLLPGFEMTQDDGCGESFIDPELAFEIVNAYGLAFARYHLYRDTSNLDLLRGDEDPYAGEVVLSHKEYAKP